jgi:integrase
VTPVEIREALAGMELASASLSKVRATLQQAYSWSEGQQLVDRNPAKYADLPTPEPARSKRALTDAELLALEETARDHLWWPMWAMSAYIGLRPGEAGAVCVDAIDLEADPPTIAVVRGLQRQRSGAVELVDELKTEAARRTIAMPAHLAATLNAHIGRQGTSGGLLFRAANDGPVHASTVRAELKILCEAAGIEPITPNELRHTAATRFAASGLPPHHLADILGHRTSRMVDEVYRHRPPVIRGPESV